MRIDRRSLALVSIVLVTVLVGLIVAVLAPTDSKSEVFSASAPEAERPAGEPVELELDVPDLESEPALEISEVAPRRQEVEAGEPAARRTGAAQASAFRIEGYFVLEELDGTRHSDVGGEFDLVVWFEGADTLVTVPVQSGKWSIELVEQFGGFHATGIEERPLLFFDPDSSDLSARGPRFGGRSVLLDDPSKRYSLAHQPIVIHAHRAESVLLHVEDALSGTALGGVTLIRATERLARRNSHPGEIGGNKLVTRNGASPIELPAAERMWVFFARTPGRAWGRVEIDLSGGGERIVQLVPGGDIDISLVGDIEQAGAKLRLRPEAEDGGRPSAEIDLAGRDRIAVEGVLPGAYSASVELGPWYRDPHTLGAGRVDVVAYGRAQVTIDVRRPEVLGKAPLAGIIIVPAEWQIDSYDFSIELLGAPLDGSDGRQFVLRRVPVAGRNDACTWTAGDVQTGTYELTFDPLQYSIVVEVGPAGATDVVFEIPAPVTVSVLVRDRDSGVPVRSGDVLWYCKRPTGVTGGGLERVERHGESELFEFRVPRGEVAFAFWGGDGYGRVTEIVNVTADHTQVVLDAPPAYSLKISYRHGETPIPWPGGAPWKAEHLDGTGKLVSQGHHGGAGAYTFDQPGRYLVELPPVDGYQPPGSVELVVGDGHPGEIVVQLRR